MSHRLQNRRPGGRVGDRAAVLRTLIQRGWKRLGHGAVAMRLQFGADYGCPVLEPQFISQRLQNRRRCFGFQGGAFQRSRGGAAHLDSARGCLSDQSGYRFNAKRAPEGVPFVRSVDRSAYAALSPAIPRER